MQSAVFSTPGQEPSNDRPPATIGARLDDRGDGRVAFCLTGTSIAGLVAGAMALSAVLWLALLAVI